MNWLNAIKYILAITAIVFLFIDWKISIGVFVVASILHVIPLGPNPLLSVITGYLILGGIVYLFFDWRIGILFIVGGFLVTKFRAWAIDRNFQFYHTKSKSDGK